MIRWWTAGREQRPARLGEACFLIGHGMWDSSMALVSVLRVSRNPYQDQRSVAVLLRPLQQVNTTAD